MRILAQAILGLALCASQIGQAAARTIPPLVPPAAGSLPWSDAERAALRARLDALFASAGIRGAHAGLYALQTRDGALLYGKQGDDEFMPASTLKLLVGSVALAKLGTGFRFHTDAFVTGSLANGTQDGLLVVRGGGDPLLRIADLNSLANAAVSTGIKSVSGGVAVDASHFDLQPYPAGWVWDDLPFYYAAKVSAASLEENVAHITVTSGSHPGDRAKLASTFPGAGETFTDVMGPGSGCRRGGDFLDIPGVLQIWPQATTGPRGSESTVDASSTPDGCTLIVGSVPLGGSDTVDPAVPSPERYLRSATGELLGKHEVVVGEPSALGNKIIDPLHYVGSAGEPRQTIWAHDSEPMPLLLRDMWFPSDNLLAECLLKSLGVARNGTPGTTQNGAAFEREWLRSAGVDTRSVTLADGSGLSIYDRITPRDLVAVLQADWNGPNRQTVIDALPVAGVRGTLREEFVDTPAAGRAFVKTGSMTHVRGLAGFLQTRRHGAVTFALLIDDWNGDSDALNAFRGSVLSALLGA